MTEIGTEVVNKLKIILAQIIVQQHVYYSYACRSCSETADEGCGTPITKAPHEKSVIPGSFTAPEVIAHIMTQRGVSNHLSLTARTSCLPTPRKEPPAVQSWLA